MDEKPPTSIPGIATKYGLFQGVLAFVVFLAGTRASINQNWGIAAVSAVIFIVLMVLAHREFKRTHQGMMTYPQGLGSGTLLAVVGAVVSSVLTYLYVRYVNAGYLATLMHTQQVALQQRGITGAQARQAMAIYGVMMTPVGIFISRLISGVIVGFIVALIVSIFTQKGDPRVVI